MKKDLVIGIVGTAILVTAMIGVFRFEASQAGGSFDVRFPTAQAETDAGEARTEAGTPTVVQVNLSAENLTRVEWVLTWTDDEPTRSGEDTATLTVASPDGATRTVSAAAGEAVLVFEGLNPVPPDATLTGSDAEAAQARARDLYASRNGTGAWNVTIAIDVGQEVPTGGLPVPVDTGNQWTLVARLTTYRAELTPS